MLRRSKSASTSASATPQATSAEVEGDDAAAGGKGRPTPTRKEAEAAAKERAKLSRDPKSYSRSERARQAAVRREAMNRGDERYLTKRDRGPMRRFIRDFIDSRLTFAEMALPIIFIGLIMMGAKIGGSFGSLLINMLVLVVALDTMLMWFLLRRQLTKRFPNENRRGALFYAFGRTLQLRFLRMPKPQVRIGEKLPDTYR